MMLKMVVYYSLNDLIIEVESYDLDGDDLVIILVGTEMDF